MENTENLLRMKMQINIHSKQRMIERGISSSLIRLAINKPDKIVKETHRKILYQKLIDGKQLDVVMRGKNMLVTTYWKNAIRNE